MFRAWKINARKFRKKLGELPFTEGGDGRHEYSSIGGPSFYHPDIVVYGNSVGNLAKALNRLDVNREGELDLSRNNRLLAPGRNRGLSRYLDSYYRKVRLGAHEDVSALEDELTEQIAAGHDTTHIKYRIRLQAIRELMASDDMLSSLFMSVVNLKLKVPETAKQGKGTRMIGDFSTPGSLLAPFLVKPLKHAFARAIEHDGAIIRFVETTKKVEIDRIVTEMYHSDKNYYIFFSDDMMCKLFIDGEWRFFNLDISSCDKSNTPAVFERLRWFYAGTAWEDLIDRACRQCAAPIVMHNPTNKSEYITAVTAYCLEFSGTILTTILNNIASSAICLSIQYHLRRGTFSAMSIDDQISNSASAVGYLVTAESCQTPEKLQFLKMSFWEDKEGNLNSFLNLGPLIRNFGTTWMDYPYARSRGETRADAIHFRNWSVLKGHVNSGWTEVHQALTDSPSCQKPKFSEKSAKVIETHLAKERAYRMGENSDEQRLMVPRASLLARYDITESEYLEMVSLCSRAKIGDEIRCNASNAILKMDYGYSSEAP